MVSNSIILQLDAETVWAKIQEEFCKAFNCRDEDLLGRTITVKTRNYWGNPIQVTQKVTEFSPPQSIAIQSQNRKDIVTTRYRVEALEPGATKVVLSVEGKNQGSILRTWNYRLMSLPVLRSGAKKRLARQLQGLKQLIEAEGGYGA
ncbi:MAG: SRPBCC family protein [Bacillota bacterium]|jgi:hypothetical protein